MKDRDIITAFKQCFPPPDFSLSFYIAETSPGAFEIEAYVFDEAKSTNCARLGFIAKGPFALHAAAAASVHRFGADAGYQVTERLQPPLWL